MSTSSQSKLRSIIVSAGEIFRKRKPRANSLADINVDRASPTPLHSETHTSPHPRTCPPDLQRQEHARSASLDCSETGKALDTSPRARPEDSRSNASVTTTYDFLQLPDYIRENDHAMEVIRMASQRKLEHTTRRFIAEGRVHTAEQHLEALRQELMDADKDLQEIETSMRTLHDLIRRTPVPKGNNLPLIYDSDGSDVTGSVSSSLEAE